MTALLREGIDRRFFRDLGFASARLHVESRLGCSARRAWYLVAIERASTRMGAALREAWITRACEVTLRRLQDEVAWALDRIVALALLEWLATPHHRDPVFERDGWRCSVPACSSRRNLHDHHLLFRSHGGNNARDNRTTVCASPHLHGLHAGIVRARGRAPSDIVWELGCRRDAEPLMRFRGDRIDSAASVDPAASSQ